MNLAARKGVLDGLYEKYNGREFVHPDPLEFLYGYDGAGDREVAGLVASSLAYGNVRQIVRSVGDALRRLGPRPASFVADASLDALLGAFEGFRHRFTSGADMAALLFGAGRVRSRHGSLGACFAAGVKEQGGLLGALSAFAAELSGEAGGPLGHLLPSPDRGSACKRLCLFLRWMVRRDEVDPGGWVGVRPADLMVPLDTHMHRIGLSLGLTRRRQGDFRTAAEITAAFKVVAPDDPVRYDFALTRLGIRPDADLGAFLEQMNRDEVR